MQITINLSDAEYKALGVVSVNQEAWAINAVKERCRIAIEEIVMAEVQKKLAAGESVSGSKEDIVMAANIESAAERNARMDAEQAALIQAQ